MVGRISLVMLTLLLCRSAWALTDEERTSRARIHLKAAIAYYDDGRYEDASREMRAAYDLRPLADLQYNLAQCYERLNKLDDAASAYEKYLAGKGDAPDRKNVQARIDHLRERARAEASGQTPPPTAPVEKVVFKTIVVYRDAPPPPGRAARWAAYGLFVLGAAGVATGIAYAVLAKQAADDVTLGGNVLSPPTFDGPLRDRQESGQSYPIISGVAFGVGALALAAGIGLYVAGQKIDQEAARREKEAGRGFHFAFGPRGGSLGYSGVF
jgi:tetratricopeptide (TPR) repeat protein